MTIAKNKQPKIIHFCTQEEAIARINTILIGNGHPEDGLAFVVRKSITDIAEIKDCLKELNGSVKTSIEASAKTGKALELYKKEMEGIDKGKSEIEEKQQLADSLYQTKVRDNWYKVLTALALIVTMYFGFRNSASTSKLITTTQSTENKIETKGVPLIIKDGKIIPLPQGSEIKFFPSDFENQDTINIKNK
jgi:hypothetical protein